MKKLLLIALVAAAVCSCKEDEGNGKLDPFAPVYLNAQNNTKQDVPSALEVIKTAHTIIVNKENVNWSRSIETQWRDTVNLRFNLPSSYCIDDYGYIEDDFIYSNDIYIITSYLADPIPYDTIAYIPNATIYAIRANIEAAFEAGNLTECYRIFEEDFVFIPCTGAQYKELKSAGLN